MTNHLYLYELLYFFLYYSSLFIMWFLFSFVVEQPNAMLMDAVRDVKTVSYSRASLSFISFWFSISFMKEMSLDILRWLEFFRSWESQKLCSSKMCKFEAMLVNKQVLEAIDQIWRCVNFIVSSAINLKVLNNKTVL